MKNRLDEESSPYLRQHAANPVHWMPWGPEALALAQEQNKPILLSIGYSACHWCHVMAHESFEDADTAALMNAYFINIKVDREERPDLDKLYQAAQQMLSGRSGGWPLTMFLTPQQQPFYGGTYFPPQSRHGLIAFPDLLTRIHEVFTQEADKIHQQIEVVQHNLAQMNAAARAFEGEPDPGLMDTFVDELLRLHDAAEGGFGQAPKFPQAAMLFLAQTLVAEEHAPSTLAKALQTSLQKMAQGGLQDHVAGGFFRYSVDDAWMIPHFEKMLYDNGQLLSLYARAARHNPLRLYKDAMQSIWHWLRDEMRHPGGAFYAALDADSEGEEGKFYVWDKAFLKTRLDEPAYRVLAEVYGLHRSANFESQWHLHQYRSHAENSQQLKLIEADYHALRITALQQLKALREQRVRPARDDKILCAWNALVIEGLALAARLHDEAECAGMAQQALDWIYQNLYQNGRLQAVWRPNQSPLNAYLDDYAYLLQALWQMLQLRWKSSDLTVAVALAETLLEQFEDQQTGGFYYTSADHESLIQRPRTWQDEAVPNAASVAALNLHRFGLLLSEPRYIQAAQKALRSVYANVQKYPLAAPGFVQLLKELQHAPRLTVLRADTCPEAWQAWRRDPHQWFFCIAADAVDLPDALAQKSADSDQDLAWICEGQRCYAPVSDPDQWAAMQAPE